MPASFRLMVRTYCYWLNGWVRTTRWLARFGSVSIFRTTRLTCSAPATLTLHTAKDIKRESWDIHLYGLMSGFQPANGIQGIDWREETLDLEQRSRETASGPP